MAARLEGPPLRLFGNLKFLESPPPGDMYFAGIAVSAKYIYYSSVHKFSNSSVYTNLM